MDVSCPKCGSKNLMGTGRSPQGYPNQFSCRDCNYGPFNPMGLKAVESKLVRNKRKMIVILLLLFIFMFVTMVIGIAMVVN